MGPVILNLAQEYKTRLRAAYGSRFVELILFGSFARNEQRPESDADFALVLQNTERPSAEIFNTAAIAADLSLKYGIPVSTLPVSKQKKETSMQGLYQCIRKEGIVV